MRRELAVATEPVTPKILPGPIQPSEVERHLHIVNHLPPAPWCELCVMGRGKDDPHLRSDLREKGEQPPVIAFDYAFVKTTSASGETEQKYHSAENDYRNAWCRFNCFRSNSNNSVITVI